MTKKITVLIVATLLLGIIGMLFLRGSSPGFLLIAIPALLVGFFIWVLPTVARRTNTKVWIATGFLILLGLIFPTSLLYADREPGFVSSLIGTILYLLPSFALVNAALLLYTGLSVVTSDTANNRPPALPLILCALLIVKTLHNLYDLTVWDNTDDGLGYIWLYVPVFIVLLSGLTLSIILPGRIKLAGPIYSILIPILLIAVSTLAQRVDFRRETMKQAERAVRAIESYYARNGSYPKTLSQLGPWYSLSHPRPMIIYGQDWCYESGDGSYRLGYIDREHWSDPRLIGRVHKTVGETFDHQPMCMQEFSAIQSRSPDYPYTYWKESE